MKVNRVGFYNKTIIIPGTDDKNRIRQYSSNYLQTHEIRVFHPVLKNIDSREFGLYLLEIHLQ